MILLTGATGFVGNAFMDRIDPATLSVYGRKPPTKPHKQFYEGEIDRASDFSAALLGVNTVIHCAARVHIMKDTSSDPTAEYMSTNCDGTLRLARAAADAGVQRFVYLSTVKVLGEITEIGAPFDIHSPLKPEDDYSRSKAEAERRLLALAEETGMDVVIIRPPLIYGPGVKANFQKLMAWVHSERPLPFASADNLRSMLYIENLTDFLHHCVVADQRIGGTYLVSDDDDLSMPQLLQYIADGMGKKARLFAVPTGLVRVVTSVFGLRRYYDRVFGELRVDIQHTKKTLNWVPPFSAREAVIKTASSYKQSLMSGQRIG